MTNPTKQIRREIDQDRDGGVKCPKCGFGSRVVDSRPGPQNSTRRRRACLASACLNRFTTYELALEDLPITISALEAMVQGTEAAYRVMGVQLDNLHNAVAASRIIHDVEQNK